MVAWCMLIEPRKGVTRPYLEHDEGGYNGEQCEHDIVDW